MMNISPFLKSDEITKPKGYLLRCDVFSNYHEGKGKPKQYGKKSDKVTEVSTHDVIIIVENKLGERYSVHIDNLQEL